MADDNVGDRALFERWRGGDLAAGEQLFERHFDSLYRFFETKCPDEVDELVQSAFLGCLRGRDALRADASFRTYLFAIARNRLNDFLRDRHRGLAIDVTVSSIEELHATPGRPWARCGDHPQLMAALRRLPVEQQTLLELHYMEEMAVGELAEVFASPEVMIRSRLQQARQQLREVLERDPALARSVFARVAGA